MYVPTVNGYFSGAGLMELGLQQAGMEIQQSYEIDETACATLALNFNHKIICDDIKNRKVLSQPESDVMVGTYPCNRYSTIADIHGTRTGDDLFLHYFRHLAIRKPEAYVVENVPGMKKYPVVMEAMTKLPDYYITIMCPVNTSCWLPQDRKRLIIFGTKRPFLIMDPVKNSNIKLRDILEPDPEITITESVYSRIHGKYRDRPIISDPDKDIAPTAVAHYAKDKGTRLVKDKRFPFGCRPYTPKEYARLQGVPDSFKFAGTDNQIYRQVGNGVAVDMGRWIGENLMRYFN